MKPSEGEVDRRLANVMHEQEMLNSELNSLTKRFRAAHARLNQLKRGGKRRLPRTPSCRSRLFLNDDDIRELAHSYWIQEGYPEGRAVEHWLRAENELMHRK